MQAVGYKWSTWEAKAEELSAQGQPMVPVETLLEK
jgi:hypothetical protein